MRTHEQLMQWQRARKRITVDTKCSQCSTPIRRRVWGGGECNIYCNKECKRLKDSQGQCHVLAKEADDRRSKKADYKKSSVYMEIIAIRRIAVWKPGQKPTVRPCRGCGRKTKGKGEYSRHCITCLEVNRRKSVSRSKAKDSYKEGKRASRLAGKARLRLAKVDVFDPIYVLNRDGWICYICGIDTPSSKRGTYEWDAPEIDHVVPIARGGEHSLANVKCCCRKCNIKKSDSHLHQ